MWAADFDKASADETAQLILQSGGAAAVLHDVRSEDDWEAALRLSDTAAVPLRVLVNCAGKSVLADTFTMPLENLRDIMGVNVEGTFLGMKHGIPRIAKAGGGAVVNVSSIAGIMVAARGRLMRRKRRNPNDDEGCRARVRRVAQQRSGQLRSSRRGGHAGMAQAWVRRMPLLTGLYAMQAGSSRRPSGVEPWLGVSMGTAYGIPVCAADPRI